MSLQNLSTTHNSINGENEWKMQSLLINKLTLPCEQFSVELRKNILECTCVVTPRTKGDCCHVGFYLM